MISDQLKLAINRLSIRDVVVKSLSCSLNKDVMPGLSGHIKADEAPSFRTKGPVCTSILEYISEDDVVQVYETRAGIQILDFAPKDGDMPLSEDQLESHVLGEIEAYFYVSYTEDTRFPERLSKESLSEFAQRNVPFNVWPYLRELVHTATSRMGLPRVVLPARHFSPAEPKVAGQVATKLAMTR